MTASLRLSSDASFPCSLSQGETWDRKSGMSPRKFSSRTRALSYREHFARRWADFLHEEFASPEEAAALFGVDGTTAKKWWAGSHSPSGFVVGLAIVEFQDRAVAMLRGS